MGKIIDRAKGNGASTVIALVSIQNVCKQYQDKEEKCPFYKRYIGCLFRGRSPREW